MYEAVALNVHLEKEDEDVKRISIFYFEPSFPYICAH